MKNKVEAPEKQIALREQKGPILKQVSPVAQAIEIAKSDIERERKEQTRGAKQTHKKTPVNWNLFQY